MAADNGGTSDTTAPAKGRAAAAPAESAADPNAIVEATMSFVTNIDGREYFVHAGRTHLRASDAIVRAKPDAFRPIRLAFSVEQATADPGEKRAR